MLWHMLIIIETVIGKTGTARFKTEKFDIDKLEFSFTTVAVNERITYSVLSEIIYADKKINFSKSDVLVNGFYSIIT